MMAIHRALFAGAALAALIGAGRADAETMSFKADLKPPPGISPTTGEGSLTATYDTESRKLSWKGKVSGLSGNPTVAHFHGPADPGQNAGVLVPAAGVKMGEFEGSTTLSNDQAKVVTGEKTFFMVHTTANPGGEVRGQVIDGK
jgi:CHRD domain